MHLMCSFPFRHNDYSYILFILVVVSQGPKASVINQSLAYQYPHLKSWVAGWCGFFEVSYTLSDLSAHFPCWVFAQHVNPIKFAQYQFAQWGSVRLGIWSFTQCKFAKSSIGQTCVGQMIIASVHGPWRFSLTWLWVAYWFFLQSG